MHWLERLYDRTFGPGARRGQLDVGFYLAAGGLLLILAAVALDVVAEAQVARSDVSKWREGAIFLGAIGAPFVLLGMGFALPARPALRFVEMTAAATTVAVAVVFLFHYPFNFNVHTPGVADYTVIDVSIYASALVVLVAGMVTQIVGIYVRRTQSGGEDFDDWSATDYDVPDWVIERDIEEAERRYPVALAGKAPKATFKVNIPDELPPDAIVGGKGHAKMINLDVPDLDGKTSRLRGMHNDEVSMDFADDTTMALKQLNRAKKESPELFKPPGFWHMLWAAIFRRKRSRHERLRRALESQRQH